MLKNRISVCILALNEENNLKKCLGSVRSLADEIVVGIDDKTNDNTEMIAKNFTEKVFLLKHNDNFHINKQKVIKKAKNKWILWMDGDEYLEEKLANEIIKAVKNKKYDGYFIPRRNYIWGKWIAHTGWYPDYQLRLFKKERTKFPCKSIHENPEIKGNTDFLKNDIFHNNYVSVEQFIEKLNRYTTNDALRLKKEIGKVKFYHFISRPFDEFVKRFLSFEGYKDGIFGLVLSVMQAFYEFVVVVKIWEENKFEEIESKDIKDKVEDFFKFKLRDWKWWKKEIKIRLSKNPVKKMWLKFTRKLGF